HVAQLRSADERVANALDLAADVAADAEPLGRLAQSGPRIHEHLRIRLVSVRDQKDGDPENGRQAPRYEQRDAPEPPDAPQLVPDLFDGGVKTGFTHVISVCRPRSVRRHRGPGRPFL